MAGYTKLFGSILESTIWLETPPIKVVWITLLAMADRDGVVEASVPGLAKRAGVERTQCEQALAVFLAPDPDSRTTEHEGRRIEVVAGGWRLLNYDIYRQRASREDAAEKNAARQKRFRDRLLRDVTITPSVTCNAIAPSPAPASSEEKEKSGAPRPSLSRPSENTDDKGFERFWAIYPKHTGRQGCEIVWKRIAPEPEFAEKIITGAQSYAAHVTDWKPEFIKAPARWLEGAHWEDETRKVSVANDPVITERAGRLVSRYQELYPLHRHGARYAVQERDHAAAVKLCQTWTDDTHLDQLAVCFLTTDHKFAEEGSRTIPQFLALASWIDGKLCEWKKTNG